MIIKLHLINLESIKRKKYKNLELKKKIINCLKRNQNQNNLKKCYLNNTTVVNNSKIFLSKQKNICAYTGRIKFYIKHYRIGRHYANKAAFFGNLQNAALKSW